jgi:hypothetical protein
MRARRPDPVWSVKVPVEDIPETGRHIDLAADEPTRTALAKEIGLRALPRLQASFDLTRSGPAGVRVVGRVSATVGQDCVVTLEPLENAVEEEVDLAFSPQTESEAGRTAQFDLDSREPPEPLQNGQIDLGAIATEFLALGIDPYPRKPDVVFEAPAVQEETAHPFAALAALKKPKGERNQ